MISKIEQERRRQQVQYGIATCELEGGTCTPEQQKLYNQYISGEISLKELGDIIRKNLK